MREDLLERARRVLKLAWLLIECTEPTKIAQSMWHDPEMSTNLASMQVQIGGDQGEMRMQLRCETQVL